MAPMEQDMPLPALSLGFIQTVNQDYDAANPPPAIVQIVSIKTLETDGKIRHRAVVSDGKHAMQAMLSTQLNSFIDNNEIARYSVIALRKFTVNVASGSKILLILDLDVVNKDVGKKIGDPQPYNEATASSSAPAPAKASPQASPTKQGSASPTKGRHMNFAPNFDSKIPDIYSIAGLNPYLNRWAIKARVQNKSDIRHWNNARGDGKLFSVDLIDDSGEIKATGFNDIVDRYYDKLEIGKIYIFSRGSVKAAKKQYTSIKNDYEITFDNASTIELCEDQNSAIPTATYHFVNFADLPKMNKDSIIDILAVVREASQPALTHTRTQKDLMKRDVVLVDKTSKLVKFTLWGSNAENLDLAEGTLVAAKGVRLSDFGGCSISALSSSSIKTNPDLTEAHMLKSWYDTADPSSFTPVAPLMGAAPSQAENSQRKMAKDVEKEGLGTKLDAPDYFFIKGVVVNIPHEKMFCYPACPDTGSKVIQEPQGWYSEKTKKYYPECVYRYIIKMSVLDCSGGLWVSGFHETGMTVLKRPPEDLLSLRDNGQMDAFEDAFKEAYFRSYLFKVRSKAEMYQGDQFTRHQVIMCKPVDYVSDSKYLLDAIAAFGN